MRSIGDQHAAKVAEDFNGYLFSHREGGNDPSANSTFTPCHAEVATASGPLRDGAFGLGSIRICSLWLLSLVYFISDRYLCLFALVPFHMLSFTVFISTCVPMYFYELSVNSGRPRKRSYSRSIKCPGLQLGSQRLEDCLPRGGIGFGTQS